MRRVALALIAALVVAGSPPEAIGQTAEANALRDVARAQERQARPLERLDALERDRARAEDRARRNAERDSRSMRRFDRP